MEMPEGWKKLRHWIVPIDSKASRVEFAGRDLIKFLEALDLMKEMTNYIYEKSLDDEWETPDGRLNQKEGCDEAKKLIQKFKEWK